MATELKILAEELRNKGYVEAGTFLEKLADQWWLEGRIPYLLRLPEVLGKVLTSALADEVRREAGGFLLGNVDLERLHFWRPRYQIRPPTRWKNFMDRLNDEGRLKEVLAIENTIGSARRAHIINLDELRNRSLKNLAQLPFLGTNKASFLVRGFYRERLLTCANPEAARLLSI